MFRAKSALGRSELVFSLALDTYRVANVPMKKGFLFLIVIVISYLQVLRDWVALGKRQIVASHHYTSEAGMWLMGPPDVELKEALLGNVEALISGPHKYVE